MNINLICLIVLVCLAYAIPIVQIMFIQNVQKSIDELTKAVKKLNKN